MCDKMENLLYNMNCYKEIWEGCMIIGGENPLMSQSDFFKKYIPITEEDFKSIFDKFHFNKLFTSEKIVTNIIGNFNCNFIYRQTKLIPDIIIYSDENYMVFQPLGEPGRDINYFKIGHFMIVNHNQENIFTLNELIPSSNIEKVDLKNRSDILNIAYNCLFLNLTLNLCGKFVIDKAISLGISLETNIREFLSYQIVNMPESIRSNRPGYKLLVDGIDICKDKDKIDKEINLIFNMNLSIKKFIQGPKHCSQIQSHIHGFICIDSISQFEKYFEESYTNIDDIIKISSNSFNEPEPESQMQFSGFV